MVRESEFDNLDDGWKGNGFDTIYRYLYAQSHASFESLGDASDLSVRTIMLQDAALLLHVELSRVIQSSIATLDVNFLTF